MRPLVVASGALRAPGFFRSARSFASRCQSTAAFDKPLKLLQKRSAIISPYDGDSTQYDYLRDEMASRLVERLADIQRTFPVAVDFGSNTGSVAKALMHQSANGDSTSSIGSTPGGIRTLHLVEPCSERLARDLPELQRKAETAGVDLHTIHLPALEGATHATSSAAPRLPFEDYSVDLVMSSMFLHWCNDLPSVFDEIKRVLKPDGVFLGCLLGGQNTLSELRSSFVLAQTDREGGVSPYVSPFAGVADIGNLLQGSGFAIPTVDADIVRCEYPSAFRLAEHLQGMGESNASSSRKEVGLGGFDTQLAMGAIYQSLYTPSTAAALEDGVDRASATSREESGRAAFDTAPMPVPDSMKDEGISATFETVFFIAWKPSSSQPKALRRGSVKKGFAAKGMDEQ